MRRFVVLPGLHGTTQLLDAFVSSAPHDARVEPVALPSECLGYEALAARLAASLRLTPDTTLVAESFSGPLAILLAERSSLAALVLCNSFAVRPYPQLLSRLPLALFARAPLPAPLVRHYIVGSKASTSLVDQIRDAVAAVPYEILACRARSALEANVASNLARLRLPILYVRGSEDNLVREKSVRQVVTAAATPVSVARIAGPHLILKTAARESWRAIDEFVSRVVVR